MTRSRAVKLAQRREAAVDRLGLVNTTIRNPGPFSELKVIQLSKNDSYGDIYKVIQDLTEIPYELRVYSFHHHPTADKRHVKRNCREWRQRRRFLGSWKYKNLIFLILRHPEENVVSSESQTFTHFKPNLTSMHVSTGYENAGDNERHPKQQIITPKSYYMRLSKHSSTNISLRQNLVPLEVVELSLQKGKLKTKSQKESARRAQQKRRKNKRALQRLTKAPSTLQQQSPEITFEVEAAHEVQQHSTQEESIDLNAEPSSFDDGRDQPSQNAENNPKPLDDWYWSADGGWTDELVFLRDGSYQYATFWSPNGYLRQDSLNPSYQSKFHQAPGSRIPGFAASSPFLGNAIENQLDNTQVTIAPGTDSHTKEAIGYTIPSTMAIVEPKAASTPEPLKKFGSANLTISTLAALVKMIL